MELKFVTVVPKCPFEAPSKRKTKWMCMLHSVAKSKKKSRITKLYRHIYKAKRYMPISSPNLPHRAQKWETSKPRWLRDILEGSLSQHKRQRKKFTFAQNWHTPQTFPPKRSNHCRRGTKRMKIPWLSHMIPTFNGKNHRRIEMPNPLVSLRVSL